MSAATASAALEQVPAWQAAHTGLPMARIAALAEDAESRRLYASAGTSVFRRTADNTWEPTGVLPHQASVAWLAINPQKVLFAATTDGLYASTDGGRLWERRFRGAGDGEAGCRMVVFSPSGLGLLATAGGAFVSRNAGADWQEAGSRLRGQYIRAVALTHAGRAYALGDRTVWASDDLTTWDAVFTLPAVSEEPAPTTQQPAVEDDDHWVSIVTTPGRPDRVLLASTRTLFESVDRGRHWRTVPGPIWSRGAIRDAIAAPRLLGLLYVATNRGVWRVDPAKGTWDALIHGLPSPDIERLLDTRLGVLAGTSAGLYALPAAGSADEPPSARELLADFAHEPSIRQVQEAAVRQADVDQHLIRRWRRRAALKAILPTFNLGLDRDHDTFINGIGSTTNPAFDRILTADDPSHSIDVGVSWDLGDLIWNDDQTSIDTRSRLMVQLRDDILNDVTRTYFERRRLQMTLLIAPPADLKTQLEHELRLEELTARLDALTDGWFSRQIPSIPAHHMERPGPRSATSQSHSPTLPATSDRQQPRGSDETG